jgi:hypothetical protein
MHFQKVGATHRRQGVQRLAHLRVRQPLPKTRERGGEGGAQQPEPKRTSVAGILNCVRVLMKKEVMVPHHGKVMSCRAQPNGLDN